MSADRKQETAKCHDTTAGGIRNIVLLSVYSILSGLLLRAIGSVLMDGLFRLPSQSTEGE